MQYKVLLNLFLLGCSAIALADEFPYEPPKNFTLNPQYIGLHHPTSTKSAAAQAFFDQGVTLLYAFNHDAAYWSFLKASEQDPHMVMAYWGMALAMGPNINMGMPFTRMKKAFQIIQEAKKYSSEASESENDYLEALSVRYTDDPAKDTGQLAKVYSDAMRKLKNKYPDDLDASVLFAESLLDVHPWEQWTYDGKPLDGTLEAVGTLESVLKKNPMHLGANHFYIHVMEASSYPERALASADRLQTLLPASGHILHMPSHIYLLVGDFQKAAASNEQAVAADREYIREYGDTGIYPVHYLSHNLYFLSRAYSMAGNFTEAKKAADELSKLYMPHFNRMPDLEYYAANSFLVLVRFHRWQDILQTKTPPKEMLATTALWHFARGAAHAALGNIDQAKQEQNFFQEQIKKIPPEYRFGYNKAYTVMEIAGDVLNAKILEAQGNNKGAEEALAKAVEAQDKIHYNEPPDWFFPVRESLGGLLLRHKKYKEAEDVFRKDLNKHPRNGRSLFGLLVALKGQDKQYDAYWANRQFQKAWMYSDEDLSVQDL